MNETDSYVLVIYKGNWADEIECPGFWIDTIKDFENWKEEIKDSFPWSFNVGSNQEIEYLSLDDLLADIKAKPITKEQMEVIEELFGGSFGFTPDV